MQPLPVELTWQVVLSTPAQSLWALLTINHDWAARMRSWASRIVRQHVAFYGLLHDAAESDCAAWLLWACATTTYVGFDIRVAWLLQTAPGLQGKEPHVRTLRDTVLAWWSRRRSDLEFASDSELLVVTRLSQRLMVNISVAAHALMNAGTYDSEFFVWKSMLLADRDLTSYVEPDDWAILDLLPLIGSDLDSTVTHGFARFAIAVMTELTSAEARALALQCVYQEVADVERFCIPRVRHVLELFCASPREMLAVWETSAPAADFFKTFWRVLGTYSLFSDERALACWAVLRSLTVPVETLWPLRYMLQELAWSDMIDACSDADEVTPEILRFFIRAHLRENLRYSKKEGVRMLIELMPLWARRAYAMILHDTGMLGVQVEQIVNEH